MVNKESKVKRVSVCMNEYSWAKSMNIHEHNGLGHEHVSLSYHYTSFITKFHITYLSARKTTFLTVRICYSKRTYCTSYMCANCVPSRVSHIYADTHWITFAREPHNFRPKYCPSLTLILFKNAMNIT